MEVQNEYLSKRQFEYISTYVGSRTTFQINNYINNEPMIKLLYEEKIRVLNLCLVLEEKCKSLEDNLGTREKDLIVAHNKLDIQGRDIEQNNVRAIWQSVLILLGGTLSGFGINLATSSSNNWAGWLMSIFGFMLQIVAITLVLVPQTKKAENNG